MNENPISLQGIQFTNHVARVTFDGITLEGRITGISSWGTIIEVTLESIGDVWRWRLHVHNPDAIEVTVMPKKEKIVETT